MRESADKLPGGRALPRVRLEAGPTFAAYGRRPRSARARGRVLRLPNRFMAPQKVVVMFLCRSDYLH
jgi:hypothetical protein